MPRKRFAQLAKTDEMRRPVSGGMLYAPKLSTCSKHKRYRRPAMKKVSTAAAKQNRIFLNRS
jgi:hypothetical protein